MSLGPLGTSGPLGPPGPLGLSGPLGPSGLLGLLGPSRLSVLSVQLG